MLIRDAELGPGVLQVHRHEPRKVSDACPVEVAIAVAPKSELDARWLGGVM